MTSNQLAIRKSLNKAYLKVKPSRSQIELFKQNLSSLLGEIKDEEYEEHNKNNLIKFLSKTYYEPNHFVNTKGKSDLVIHNGKDAKTPVGVIIETKRPGSKSEMPTKKDINSKAIHELILYYLRERITNKNLEVKYLIATDIYEWFIFNSQDFEKIFAKNKKLISDFLKFEEGRLASKNTDFFYNEIAKPFVASYDESIPVTWFDIRDYKPFISSGVKESDNKFIPLFKILSPEHLLNLQFTNDSNTLDKKFYNELLHIIGLEERKAGSKKLIGRKAEGKRDNGSLIENAINILNYEDCLRDIERPQEYGESQQEQLYHIALELTITWINRILFLKLLEGQLIKYNNGDASYKFMSTDLIPDYDALNKLFFQVLAVKEKDRGESIKEKYKKIPYLNSSLFEPNNLEHKTIKLSSLEDDYQIPIINSTVLKNSTGKKKSGKINPLSYLLEFLDSYDFSSEGSEDISEENKTLINASVLGLIFEKINGYKDGSFFTPGFITMYMCRETIRRAVVQKFNDAKNWKCENLDDLYNKIGDIDKKEANTIINSLKICDPAVGSGHFLVSALNEIIAIKSELKILMDSKGKVLRDYHIEVVNDELAITDEDGEFFEYHPKSPESQRIQETLFHEKQTIIENCLFGVDINQNSVKICRLRLWIELLKNAYYKPDSGLAELETLPNIDINIKCGNSLISRYPLDADIKKALKKSKWTIDSYRLAVMTYRNAENKEEKASMRKLIEEIKSDFESEVSKSDKRFLRLNKLKGELLNLTSQGGLFELGKKEKSEWNKKVKKTSDAIDKLESELEEIRNNKIYENAFEWRFEFPEVLDNDGNFVGFDVVIGNPPYSSKISKETIKIISNYKLAEYKCDPYSLFIERSLNISSDKINICLITPLTYLTNHYYFKLRKYIILKRLINSIIVFDGLVFDEANVDTAILELSTNSDPKGFYWTKTIPNNIDSTEFHFRTYSQFESETRYEIFEYRGPEWENIKTKLVKDSIPLKELRKISLGMKLRENDEFIRTNQSADYPDPIIFGKDIGLYKPLKYERYFSWINSIKIGGTQSIKVYKHKPKILIQAIRNLSLSRRIVGTMDSEGVFFIGTVNGLTPVNSKKDFIINEYYLLAIINSTLMNAYFKSKYTTISLTSAFLGELPIKVADKEVQENIAKLVIDIFNNQGAEEELLKTIDKSIYRLYGIKESEIKIIEEISLN